MPPLLLLEGAVVLGEVAEDAYAAYRLYKTAQALKKALEAAGQLKAADQSNCGGLCMAMSKKKSKSSGKEKASDRPSWAEGQKPKEGEPGKDFAGRLLDEKYGPGNWKDTGPGSEYNQLKKFGDRYGK